MRNPLLPTTALAFALALAAGVAAAQPGSNPPDQFGDRQSGQFGDPAQGHFGNPAAGDFDKSKLKEPPAGARPLGRVSRGKPSDNPPYVTLPTPADAAAAPAEDKPAAKKKRSSKKKTGNG